MTMPLIIVNAVMAFVAIAALAGAAVVAHRLTIRTAGGRADWRDLHRPA